MSDNGRLARLATIPDDLTVEVGKTLTETDIVNFLGICGDVHPLYQNELVASRTRFAGRIAPGSLLVGMVSRAMAEVSGPLPPPGGVSYQYDLQFLAPVRAGDTISVRLTVKQKNPERYQVHLQATALNQHGQQVLSGETVLKVL